MGALDPKLNSKRAFLLLARKGATRAVLSFQGGHDEGSVESITLTLKSGEEVELEAWYCAGYGMETDANGEYQWVPLSKPENQDEELSELLQGPIDERFGSWGGVGSTYGSLTWDVTSRTVVFNYEQDQPRGVHERVSF